MLSTFGVFGLVTLNNVNDGIATPVKTRATPSQAASVEVLPSGFRDLEELYQTADIRNHTIKGFISSEAGTFYTI